MGGGENGREGVDTQTTGEREERKRKGEGERREERQKETNRKETQEGIIIARVNWWDSDEHWRDEVQAGVRRWEMKWGGGVVVGGGSGRGEGGCK